MVCHHHMRTFRYQLCCENKQDKSFTSAKAVAQRHNQGAERHFAAQLSFVANLTIETLWPNKTLWLNRSLRLKLPIPQTLYATSTIFYMILSSQRAEPYRGAEIRIRAALASLCIVEQRYPNLRGCIKP